MSDEARINEIEARLSAAGLSLHYDNAPRGAPEIPAWLVMAIPAGPASREVGSTDRGAFGATKLEALEQLELRVVGP